MQSEADFKQLEVMLYWCTKGQDRVLDICLTFIIWLVLIPQVIKQDNSVPWFQKTPEIPCISVLERGLLKADY